MTTRVISSSGSAALRNFLSWPKTALMISPAPAAELCRIIKNSRLVSGPHPFKNLPGLTLIEQKTWEDPIVVGQNRNRTDINSFGVKLAAENIVGSGLTLKYGWARQTIDAEKSGSFLLSQPDSPLAPGDLDDLDRDAHFHRITAEYSFPIAPRMMLKPILRYTRGDAKGNANSFHSLSPELSFLYFDKQLQASLNDSTKAEWYDRRHPVFKKTRRDINLGLLAILGYKDPFGFKNFRIDWFNAFFNTNSNIDFFESSNFITALGLGYSF